MKERHVAGASAVARVTLENIGIRRFQDWKELRPNHKEALVAEGIRVRFQKRAGNKPMGQQFLESLQRAAWR